GRLRAPAMRQALGAVWRAVLAGADPLARVGNPEGRFHHAGQWAIYTSLTPEGHPPLSAPRRSAARGGAAGSAPAAACRWPGPGRTFCRVAGPARDRGARADMGLFGCRAEGAEGVPE